MIRLSRIGLFHHAFNLHVLVFLGCKTAKNRLLASSYLSVCCYFLPHETTRLPLLSRKWSYTI